MIGRKNLRSVVTFAFLALTAIPPMQASAAAGQDSGKSARAQLYLEAGKAQLVRLARPATSVFVADPKVADVDVKSPKLIYVLGKAPGHTTLYAIGENDDVVYGGAVTVTHNLIDLNDELKSLVTGTVSARSVGDAVVLIGSVPSPADADEARRVAGRFVDEKRIENKLKIDAPNQITLRVRIAEMSRSTMHELGVNWDGVLGGGGMLFGLAAGNPVVAAGTVLGTGNNGGRQFQTRQNGANSIIGSFASGKVDINTMIDALDKNGTVKMLAEPNLSALSGETASFLAGGEFPVPIPQGNNNVAIEFKKFGVSLTFVATLAGQGRINLHVRPEVSQLSTAGAIQIDGMKVPSLTTRRAETAVDLGSGQSFAIAGLLQNNAQNDVSALPWLGDIPVLGALFRSQQFQKNETELVIIVTPYITKPVSAPTVGAQQGP